MEVGAIAVVFLTGAELLLLLLDGAGAPVGIPLGIPDGNCGKPLPPEGT